MSAKKKINIIDFNTIIEEEEKEKEQKNTKELNARQKLEEAKDHALDEFDSFSEDSRAFLKRILFNTYSENAELEYLGYGFAFYYILLTIIVYQ